MNFTDILLIVIMNLAGAKQKIGVHIMFLKKIESFYLTLELLKLLVFRKDLIEERLDSFI